MTSLEERRKQLAERFLQASSSPSARTEHSAGKRPSAAEWLSGGSPATQYDGPASSTAKTKGAKPSAAAWCDHGAAPVVTRDDEGDAPCGRSGDGGGPVGGSAARRRHKREAHAKLSTDCHDSEEEDDRGGPAKQTVNCSWISDDGDVDDVADEWPKLDVNQQHFSSKEEPIMLRDDPPASVPAHVARFLREYQREGVRWLFGKYSENKGCILGDDMGLGKTVQTAALLIAVLNKTCTATDVKMSTKIRRLAENSALKGRTPCSSFTRKKRMDALKLEEGGPGSETKEDEVHLKDGAEPRESGSTETRVAESEAVRVEERLQGEEVDQKGPVLIVCPASLMKQWKTELLTWAHFEVEVAEGKRKDEVLHAVMAGELEVVVCSYSCYLQNAKSLNALDWELAIFDECHTIKNPNSATGVAAKGLQCKRRIGLTGTLMQNNMMEMYCTLSWAVPECLGPHDAFDEGYRKPIGLGNKIDASDENLRLAREKAQQLKNIVGRHVLRREKDLIKDQMPGKEDNIVICPMSEEQREVYERVLASADYDLLRRNSEPCPCGSKKQGGEPLWRRNCCYAHVSQVCVWLAVPLYLSFCSSLTPLFCLVSTLPLSSPYLICTFLSLSILPIKVFTHTMHTHTGRPADVLRRPTLRRGQWNGQVVSFPAPCYYKTAASKQPSRPRARVAQRPREQEDEGLDVCHDGVRHRRKPRTLPEQVTNRRIRR